MDKKGGKHKLIVAVSAGILLGISLLIFLAVLWVTRTWANLTMDELLYHLTTSLSGTNSSYLTEYLLTAFLPAVIIILLYAVILKKYSEKSRVIIIAAISVSLVSIILTVFIVNSRLKVFKYMESLSEDSSFIEENYTDPSEVNITFPEGKRNLIYIFLESMEITYADKENGGGMKENYIPKLTRLAEENECFSEDEHLLNGAVSFPGTTWTTGGMFAAISGLPVKTFTFETGLPENTTIYPGISTIGEILKDNGYTNVLFLGSDASFGGRDNMYRGHGDFEVIDLKHFVDIGYVPRFYNSDWWGLEDTKLFEKAKEELLQLSEKNEPFFFTTLTVDTHFEDGYVCPLCQSEHGKDQYGNVISCSDRQVTEFVEWLSQQDFYENTTVILAGDHPTMDSDFCKKVSSDYQRRVYTAYINTAHEDEGKRKTRQYSTFDFFPTSLSAIGAEIEGNRLGLGTDLYSDEATIIEKYGYDYCFDEISKNSTFLKSLTVLNDDYLRKLAEGITVKIEKEDGGYNVTCERFKTNLAEATGGVYVAAVDEETATMLEMTASESDSKKDILPENIPLTEMTLANSYGMVYEAYVKTDINAPVFILCMRRQDGSIVFIQRL